MHALEMAFGASLKPDRDSETPLVLERWTAIEWRTDASPDVVAREFASLIDAPLSARRPFGTVELRTIFGSVSAEHVHAEAFGPFAGRSAWNGMGIWQPVLDLKVVPDGGGTVVRGHGRFRRSFVAAAILLIVWDATLLGGALSSLGQARDVASPWPWVAALIGLVVIPSAGFVRAWRLGLADRRAVIDQFRTTLERL